MTLSKCKDDMYVPKSNTTSQSERVTMALGEADVFTNFDHLVENGRIFYEYSYKTEHIEMDGIKMSERRHRPMSS